MLSFNEKIVEKDVNSMQVRNIPRDLICHAGVVNNS